MKRVSAALLLVTVCACSSPSRGSDGGGQVQDAGGFDAGPADAGPLDAGNGFDACCSTPLVYDSDAGACVVGPVLELGDCPQYIGLGCALSFMPVPAGDASTETITIFNQGEAPLQISSIELAPASEAFALLSGVPAPIGANDYASVSVRFQPVDAGLFRSTLVISGDAVNGTQWQVPVEGATPGSQCSQSSDCLITEVCSSGTCASCPSITPPPCPDGRLISVTDGSGCPQPTCRCPDGTVYGSGGHCSPAIACDADGGCSAGSCDPNACCSFPFCLCAIDGGACR